MPFDNFDWKNPDYRPVYLKRAAALTKLRSTPALLPKLRLYYRDHPIQFIEDWGITYDPRPAAYNGQTTFPFVLFPRQREFLEWIIAHLLERSPGLCEKSREVGVSWLAISLACTLCIFRIGFTVSFGSNKLEKVDTIGDPDSLLEKARIFMGGLPEEFRAGWRRADHAPHKRLIFPDSGSRLTGEGGDEIGRGGRRTLQFVDESAHLERPMLVDAALSNTTDCRIDMSSVRGMSNKFAEKRFAVRAPMEDRKAPFLFTFHWRDDLRKDEAWYARKSTDLNDPIVVAQEIDIDYQASVVGVLIPAAWVQAAVGAGQKLGFSPTGRKAATLDVADEGEDRLAMCGGHGVFVQQLEEWSGEGGDIYASTQRAFRHCDEWGCSELEYDADGMGAGVRGDARVINEQREGHRRIKVYSFRGSGGVLRPDDKFGDRTNKDFFYNFKAQAWWSLRERFERTWKAVTGGVKYDMDELISLNPGLSLLPKLMVELSQPTRGETATGKVIINKKPDGTKSPNLADAVMIYFAPKDRGMVTMSRPDFAQVLKVFGG